MSDEDPTDIKARLQREKEWAQNQYDTASKGYKRVRQMRGSNAHERSWALKEQMEKSLARIKRIDDELVKLENSESPG
jgi:hypothetical protein